MRWSVAKTMMVAGALGASVAVYAASSSGASPAAPRAYVAHLRPLNAEVAGTPTRGAARFTVHGDLLTIEVEVHGAPAGIAHLQHLHGFVGGKKATCATQAADANHDGVVDLIETEPMSGTTMVPLTADPVSMQIVTDTYPKANAEGAYRYLKTVSLSALEKAFAAKFDGQALDITRRVVYVHGVPADTSLPASAASLDAIPAQVTLPIACGEIAPGAP